MAVRQLTKDGDFTFGQGQGNYIQRDDEISQNVVTRVRSFKNDYFLDITANIDWFRILSIKNNQSIIINEVRKVVQQTDGVVRLNDVSIVENNQRNAVIQIDFDTIYNQNVRNEIGISANG